MLITFLGIFAFVLLLLYDIATLKKLRFRSFIILLGYLFHLIAIFAATMQGDYFLLPSWTIWPAWLLTLAGAAWLCYCLFLFPALRHNYVAESPVLTTEGPYALTRHPGILGYIAFLAGLIFLSHSVFLVQNSILWLMFNLSYVFLQDVRIFPKLFPGYSIYRETTPMLLPNIKSTSRFFNSM